VRNRFIKQQIYLFFSLGLFFFFCGCSPYFQKLSVSPEEISKKDFNFITDTGSLYLIDFAEVVVNPSGSHTTTIHQKILITGEKGKQHGTLQISYDSERQKVEIIEAKTITPENKILPVDRSSIRYVTPAELSSFSVLYPGIKVCTVTFPSAGIGSIVEYTYKIKTEKPLMEGEFWDGFFFQSTDPFVISHYRLIVPESMHLYTFPFSVEMKEKKKQGKFICYEWEKRNMPAIIPEKMMPPIEEVVPKILVTSLDNWDRIGRWFYNLSRDSTIPDSTIKSFTLELTEKSKNNEEKIKTIYHYICKNIRYIGLELGIHGFKPHAAKDVFKLGYGDCKDKAALMVAMLKSVNIPAYIALVNTERQIEENVPFPGQFNHAIIAIPVDNNFLLLDPTSEVFPFPELPPYNQNKHVLVPTENTTFLIKSPVSGSDENKKQRQINVTMDETGNIDVDVTMYASGIFAAGIRDGFRYLSDEERKRELSRSLNSMIPNTSLKKFVISGIESLEVPVKELYSFVSKRYATMIKDKMLFKPALIEKMEGTELTSLEKRNFSIRFPYKSSNHDSIIFHLPTGYQIDALPDNIDINNKFGTYSVNFKIEENKIVYTRTYSIDTLEISPEEYDSFKKFYEQVSYYDNLPVILKKSH